MNKIKYKNFTPKGFSLIEIAIVFSIAAVIAVIIYMAIAPAQRVGKANNARRVHDAEAIEKAIKAVLLDENIPPAVITDIEEGVYYSLVTAGADTSGQYTCGELGQAIDRLDIASTLQSFLGEMPVDPDISSGVDTGYYLIRRGNFFDVGYCNWYEAPTISLPGSDPGSEDWTNYNITETGDVAFGAGTMSSLGEVLGTGDDTSLVLKASEVDNNIGLTPHAFTFSDYDNTIWVVATNNLFKMDLNTDILAQYTISSIGTDVLYDSSTDSIWTLKFSNDQLVKLSPADGSVLSTYSVGDGPYRMVFDDYSNSIWVSNYYANTVSKIDPSDGSVLATYSVGTQPRYITFDSSTNSIWVVNYSDDTISKISIDSGSVNTYTPGFTVGSSITFDSSTGSIWVADSTSNNIYKVASADGSLSASYSMTDPSEITFDSSTNSIWVYENSLSVLKKISPADGSVLGTYNVGTGVAEIMFDDYSNVMWSINSNDYTLSKIKTSDGSDLFGTNYGVGNDPYGVAFDSSTNSIWVANYNDHTVSKIDVSSGSITGTYNTGGNYPYGVAFDSSTNSIWVANHTSASVTKFSASDGSVIGTYSVGTSPKGVIFDSSTGSIWVANSGSNTVTKLQASDGSVIGTYAAGTTPEALALDSSTGSIWVANNTYTGTLIKLQASDGSTLGTYNVGQYARGVAFDSSTGSIWVAFEDELKKFRASDGLELYHFSSLPGVTYSKAVIFDDTNGYVWMLGDRIIMKVDPSNNTILSISSIPGTAVSLVYDSYTNSIWASGGTAASYGDIVRKVSASSIYASPAVFTSQILDTTVNTVFDTVSWNSTEPSSTSISVLARTSNNSSMTGATDWASCSAISNGVDISENSCVTDGDKYIQYRVTLNTTDSRQTPSLEDITINYSADADTLSNPYCGDLSCNGSENASSCPGDCSAVCGDTYCTHSESTATCPADCGTSCGDAACNGDESTATCPADCGTSCGDAACNGDETCSSCSADCGVCANSAPTVSDSGRTPANAALNQAYNVQLNWDDWTDPNGDIVEYQTVVYLGTTCSSSVVATQTWSTNSYYNTNLLYSTIYSWRTKARDQNHQLESDFNTCYYYYTEADPGGSCPFVYLWDGDSYDYLTDIKGQPIGFPEDHFKAKKTKYYMPNRVPLAGFEPVNGEYKLKFRETLKEMDYFDELKLMLVDHPVGYEIYSSTEDDRLSLEDKKQPMILYTVKDPRLPISATDQDGRDVLDEVSYIDNKLAQDYDVYDSYIDLDFGQIDNPQYAKLVMDGWSIYQLDRKVQKPFASYVEVINEDGQWEKVKEFGFINGDLKGMIVELYDVFKTDDYRIRVHLGYNFVSATLIDRIRLDDSEPIDLQIQTVSPSKAELYHAGSTPYVYGTPEHRIINVKDESQEDISRRYFYGNFTKYGEVSELLQSADDMFVIFRHGDALEVSFPSLAEPALGYQRTPVLHADVLYKIIYENRSGKYGEVEDPYSIYPLPFKGMSQYPYHTEVENYPNDKAHQDYLEIWNTRVCEAGLDYCYDRDTGYRILTAQQRVELDRAYQRFLAGHPLPASGKNVGDIANLEYAKTYYGYLYDAGLIN